jgi:hypothetical protein
MVIGPPKLKTSLTASDEFEMTLLMSPLLQYLPLKALARSLRASFGKLPMASDAGSLAPDDAIPVEPDAERFAGEDAAALEARVTEIVRTASKVPPGPLRRDALAEANRIRKRAIELRRRADVELKARIAARPTAASSNAMPRSLVKWR